MKAENAAVMAISKSYNVSHLAQSGVTGTIRNSESGARD